MAVDDDWHALAAYLHRLERRAATMRYHAFCGREQAISMCGTVRQLANKPDWLTKAADEMYKSRDAIKETIEFSIAARDILEEAINKYETLEQDQNAS